MRLSFLFIIKCQLRVYVIVEWCTHPASREWQYRRKVSTTSTICDETELECELDRSIIDCAGSKGQPHSGCLVQNDPPDTHDVRPGGLVDHQNIILVCNEGFHQNENEVFT